MEIITVEPGSEVWFAQQSADYMRLSNQSVIVFSCDKDLMETIIGLIKQKVSMSVKVDVCQIKRPNANPVAVVHRKGYAVDRVTPSRVKGVALVAQIYLFSLDGVSYRLIEKRLEHI
jgi:hypothetical protein